MSLGWPFQAAVPTWDLSRAIQLCPVYHVPFLSPLGRGRLYGNQVNRTETAGQSSSAVTLSGDQADQHTQISCNPKLRGGQGRGRGERNAFGYMRPGGLGVRGVAGGGRGAQGTPQLRSLNPRSKNPHCYLVPC